MITHTPKRTLLYYPYIMPQNDAFLRRVLLYWDEIAVLDTELRSAYLDKQDVLDHAADIHADCHIGPMSPTIEYGSCPLSKKEKDIELAKTQHNKDTRLFLEDCGVYRAIKLDYGCKKELSSMLNQADDKLRNLTVSMCCYGNNKNPVPDISSITDVLIKERLSALGAYMHSYAHNSTEFIIPGTDQLHNEILAYGEKSEKTCAARIITVGLLPAPGPNVPWVDIVKFRKENWDQLLALRVWLSNLEQRILSSSTEVEVKDAIMCSKEVFINELNYLKKGMIKAFKSDVIIPTFQSIFSWKTPAVALAVGKIAESMIGAPIESTTAVVGIATGAIKVMATGYKSILKYENKWCNRSLSYLSEASDAGIITLPYEKRC